MNAQPSLFDPPAEIRKPSDSEWLLMVLSDRKPHLLTDILSRSIGVRGHGLTVHSRVADLRAQGHVIANRTFRTSDGRCGSEYRLLS